MGHSLQGVITVKGLVDREKGDFYTLTVVADDGSPKMDSTVVSGCPVEAPLLQSMPTPGCSQTHRNIGSWQSAGRTVSHMAPSQPPSRLGEATTHGVAARAVHLGGVGPRGPHC